MQVWSGMAYKNNLFSFSSEKGRPFDPLFARRENLGELLITNY